jgi:molybdate transport system substrate-binding protein
MEGKMKGKYIPLSLLILTCTIFLVAVIGCGSVSPLSSPSLKEILVFAAAGTKPAIDEAAKLFEQKTGTKVTINYGGGGEVLSNMALAKTGDVYSAPEQRFMEAATEKGAVDPKTIRSVAYMIPVIAVAKGNPKGITNLTDLTRPGIRVAITRPETTLLGKYAPEIFRKAGLAEAIEKNIVTQAARPDSLLTMLIMGQVDAGIIWHYFGTTASNDVDIIWIPKEYVTGIGEIQAAVSTYSQEAKTAQKFIDLLVSSEGKEIFKKNGYIIDSEEANKYWLATQ